VLVTDGYVGKPGASTMAVLQNAVLGVALTPGSRQREDLQQVVDHWVELA